MKTLLLFFAGIAASMVAFAQPAFDTVTFMAPDTVVTWVVPPGNDSISVMLRGGKGGQYTSLSTGAVLGYAGNGFPRDARIKVSSGDTLFLFVGGTGYTGLATGQEAFNGGGKNSADSYGTAGGGGGASDIRKGGKSLSNRIFISGGGGGASYNGVTNNSASYSGGSAVFDYGINGGPGSYGGGFGARPTYGGRGGTNGVLDTGSRGSLGQGGSGGVGAAGGGGGGGYYGGGGGSLGGGGGGSSWGDGIQAGPGVRPIELPNALFSSGYISIVYIKNGVGISLAPSLFSDAAIVPNPSLSTANLSLPITRQTKVQVQLYDPTGKMVWNQSKNLAAGPNTVALPASELPAGLYMVRIKAEGQESDTTLKWIKE